MGNNEEDTNQNTGTIFFLILFSLFVLAFSSKSERQISASSGYSLQDELAFGNISIHSDAIVFNAVSLPDLDKSCIFAMHNKSLNPFSLQYKISSFNQRTTQNFINIQKTRLVIEPLFLWRLYCPFSLSEKEDVPVLS
jgi:hypothetical protein